MALKRLSKELGFELEVVGISEIDKYAIKSYEAIHGLVKNYGGIGDFDRFPKDIDICTWRFPCQDISLAGKQRGMSDGTRSNYGYVFLDTVENTPENERPQVLIMENVKALVSQVFEEEGDGDYIDRPHQKRGVVQKGIIQTIKTSGNDVGVVVLNKERLIIRKLTPREAGRLMGVSEEDIDEILSVNSNTQAYKQFGNSIVVDVIYYIFRELLIKDADMEWR